MRDRDPERWETNKTSPMNTPSYCHDRGFQAEEQNGKNQANFLCWRTELRDLREWGSWNSQNRGPGRRGLHRERTLGLCRGSPWSIQLINTSMWGNYQRLKKTHQGRGKETVPGTHTGPRIIPVSAWLKNLWFGAQKSLASVGKKLGLEWALFWSLLPILKGKTEKNYTISK